MDFESETFVTHALTAEGFDASEDGSGRGTPVIPVLYRTSGNDGCRPTGDRSGAITTSTDPCSHHNGIAGSFGVRRLTPRECERLQGFPDDATQIPHRGKSASDGPRYKALGNSMAVPCMRWIGERIQAVQSLIDTPQQQR